MDQEAYEHAQEIEYLRRLDPKKLARKRLNDLIESYKNGEIPADELLQNNNVIPH